MSNQEKGYNGNPNLPRENSKIEWTPELISEFIKCKDDPVYFAERYMKIVHIDRGLITIPLYDYQKEIIRAYPNNLKIALNQSRQSGKCVDYNSLITVRNKKTGEIKTMPIGEFHSLFSCNKQE